MEKGGVLEDVPYPLTGIVKPLVKGELLFALGASYFQSEQGKLLPSLGFLASGYKHSQVPFLVTVVGSCIGPSHVKMVKA